MRTFLPSLMLLANLGRFHGNIEDGERLYLGSDCGDGGEKEADDQRGYMLAKSPSR